MQYYNIPKTVIFKSVL